MTSTISVQYSHGTQALGIKSSFVNGASYFPSNRQYMEMPEAVFSLQPYAACTHAWPKKQTVAPLSKKIKTAAPKDRRRPLSLSRDMINR